MKSGWNLLQLLLHEGKKLVIYHIMCVFERGKYTKNPSMREKKSKKIPQ